MSLLQQSTNKNEDITKSKNMNTISFFLKYPSHPHALLLPIFFCPSGHLYLLRLLTPKNFRVIASLSPETLIEDAW